jgi:hypothetical protein
MMEAETVSVVSDYELDDWAIEVDDGDGRKVTVVAETVCETLEINSMLTRLISQRYGIAFFVIMSVFSNYPVIVRYNDCNYCYCIFVKNLLVTVTGRYLEKRPVQL